MPSPAWFLALAVGLPLLGGGIVLFLGKRMGPIFGGWVGSGFLLAAFACSLFATVKWYEGKSAPEGWGFDQRRPILRTFNFSGAHASDPVHRRPLDVGIYVDSLTIALFVAVTLIASSIHVYAIGFIRNDERFARLFALTCFACFATLGLILSGTLFQLLIFAPMTGMCVYFLSRIFENRHRAGTENDDASPRTPSPLTILVIDLIGQCAMVVGFALLFGRLASSSWPGLWSAADAGILAPRLAATVGIWFFVGAASKCAQFPIHIWLADGIADAPAPVGALVCSILSAVPGIYLMARLFPILTAEVRLVIAILGLVTLTMAAITACAQSRLQHLLAWCAVSQMGYMVLGFGVGSWFGPLLQLVPYTFFISLLFLASGSVIAATGGQQKIRRLGGLLRRMPVTAGAFLAGTLAIAGVPFTGGHEGHWNIASDAAAFALLVTHSARRGHIFWIFFALPIGASFLTIFYLARSWLLIFGGRRQLADRHAGAREHPSAWGPTFALAVAAIVAGYAINIPALLRSSMGEAQSICGDLMARGPLARPGEFSGFDQAWPDAHAAAPESDPAESIEPSPPPTFEAQAQERGRFLARWWTGAALLAGVMLALFVVRQHGAVAKRLFSHPPLSWVHAWAASGMYLDELYYWTVVRALHGLRYLARLILTRIPGLRNI